jgi:hypothetical protein
MFEVGIAVAAAAGEALIARERARADLARITAEREQEAWEDEHLLPAMQPEERARFLAERRRLKERREDIARAERQHRELLAVEREKAASIREAGRQRSDGFLRGLIWGEILGR